MKELQELQKKSLISAKEIDTIIHDCLYKTEEPPQDMKFVAARGIIRSVGFIPEKIEEHHERIKEILYCLPEQFREDKGGGWSFLKAPFDKNGEQWGEQTDAEQLLLLGLAAGYVKYLLEDKRMWSVFPGSVPYFMVLNKRQPVEPKTKTELIQERKKINEKLLGDIPVDVVKGGE